MLPEPHAPLLRTTHGGPAVERRARSGAGPDDGEEAMGADDAREHDADARAEAVDEAVREAAALAAEGRWDRAYEIVSAALERQGDDPVLLAWLGLAARRQGEDGEAYEHFRRALALDLADPFLLAAAGTGLAALDDPEAEPALRLAALSAPGLAYARVSYGAYLAREGMTDDALRELEAARDLEPEDATVRTELGGALILAGRREEGADEMETALALAEDDAWVRTLYGLVLVELDRLSDAAVELHRAAAEAPGDVEAQLLSALASGAEGWDSAAWDALAAAQAAAEGLEAALVAEAEERLEEGPEAAAALLREHLAPSTLRRRLLERA